MREGTHDGVRKSTPKISPSDNEQHTLLPLVSKLHAKDKSSTTISCVVPEHPNEHEIH